MDNFELTDYLFRAHHNINGDLDAFIKIGDECIPYARLAMRAFFQLKNTEGVIENPFSLYKIHAEWETQNRLVLTRYGSSFCDMLDIIVEYNEECEDPLDEAYVENIGYTEYWKTQEKGFDDMVEAVMHIDPECGTKLFGNLRKILQSLPAKNCAVETEALRILPRALANIKQRLDQVKGVAEFLSGGEENIEKAIAELNAQKNELVTNAKKAVETLLNGDTQKIVSEDAVIRVYDDCVTVVTKSHRKVYTIEKDEQSNGQLIMRDLSTQTEIYLENHGKLNGSPYEAF